MPDRLYLSDGTEAVVNVAANVAGDGPASWYDREVSLTADMTTRWSYLRFSDPGANMRLARVVRSDRVEIPVGENAWQTTWVFAEGNAQYLRQPRLHLLDYASPGSYTLYYAVDDPVAPG